MNWFRNSRPVSSRPQSSVLTVQFGESTASHARCVYGAWRFAAGVISPDQLRALASVAKRYGNGKLHLTTRQDVQVHGVALDDLCHVVGELQAADVLILGGGGNALRNILACSDAGV